MHTWYACLFFHKFCNVCLQEHLQIVMSAQFAKQEAALKNKVAELEAEAAANRVA